MNEQEPPPAIGKQEPPPVIGQEQILTAVINIFKAIWSEIHGWELRTSSYWGTGLAWAATLFRYIKAIDKALTRAIKAYMGVPPHAGPRTLDRRLRGRPPPVATDKWS